MNYKKLVPKDSFIGQYMEYMSEVETPHAYDFWTAVWAIGVKVGRSIYVDRPRIPVFLNWYIVLCAESGITRKSTSVKAGERLVIKSSDAFIATGKTTGTRLDRLLHELTRDYDKAELAFAVPEMVTILGKEAYLTSMPGLLTDLYDCPELRKLPGTISMGEIVQRNVYISLLTASTPSWLITAMNPAVIEGGFTSRVIFIAEDRPKRSIAWPSEKDKIDWSGIIQRLCDFESVCQPISINASALRAYTSWYRKRLLSVDPFRSSFEAREDDHLLRLAACLSINDGTFEIQTRHIKCALNVLNHIKDKAYTLFDAVPSASIRLGEAVEKLRIALINAGNDGTDHTPLYNKCRYKMNAKEFKTLLSIMHECGMIQIFEKKTGRGRTYRATAKLQSPGIVSQVLERIK